MISIQKSGILCLLISFTCHATTPEQEQRFAQDCLLGMGYFTALLFNNSLLHSAVRNAHARSYNMPTDQELPIFEIDEMIAPEQEEEKQPSLEDFFGGEIPVEITETIDYLKDSERYAALGANMRQGLLLYGPPGTGKTTLARAIAAVADCEFIHASGSEFDEVFVGLGASRIRELFDKARKALSSGKRAAIIFIDEIDAIGGKRFGFGGGDQQTLNQLLTCMDGFEKNESIIVIAATNKVEVLDSALLRPGRFDSKVYIGPPSQESRKAILDLYLSKRPIDESVDSIKLAELTDGLTGAELKDLVNEAALCAVRSKVDVIREQDCLQALKKYQTTTKSIYP